MSMHMRDDDGDGLTNQERWDAFIDSLTTSQEAMVSNAIEHARKAAVEAEQARADLAHELDAMRRERDLALEKRYQRELALDYQRRYNDLAEATIRDGATDAMAQGFLRDSLNLQAKVEEQLAQILDLQDALTHLQIKSTVQAIELMEQRNGRAELVGRINVMQEAPKAAENAALGYAWQAAAVISIGAWITYAIARAAL